VREEPLALLSSGLVVCPSPPWHERTVLIIKDAPPSALGFPAHIELLPLPPGNPAPRMVEELLNLPLGKWVLRLRKGAADRIQEALVLFLLATSSLASHRMETNRLRYVGARSACVRARTFSVF
jgi:hypothetical protein